MLHRQLACLCFLALVGFPLASPAGNERSLRGSTQPQSPNATSGNLSQIESTTADTEEDGFMIEEHPSLANESRRFNLVDSRVNRRLNLVDALVNRGNKINGANCNAVSSPHRRRVRVNQCEFYMRRGPRGPVEDDDESCSTGCLEVWADQGRFYFIQQCGVIDKKRGRAMKLPRDKRFGHVWLESWDDFCPAAPVKEDKKWLQKGQSWEFPKALRAGDECAPSVVDYGELPSQEGLRMAKLGATALVATMTAAAAFWFPVGAWIIGAAVSGLVSMFFPEPSEQHGPCARALDYGLCVWQQIIPFAEKYIKEKLDQRELNEYEDQVAGVRSQLRHIKLLIDHDSTKDREGNVVSVSPHVLPALHTVYLGMLEYKPRFTGKNAPPKAAYFLGQFANLHISVASAAFALCRSPAHKRALLDRIDEYTVLVKESVQNAKRHRLSHLVTSSESCHTCRTPGTNHVTPGFCRCSPTRCYRAEDTWSDCEFKVDECSGKCNGERGRPEWLVDRRPFFARACFGQHKQWVEQRQNQFWEETTLSSIPEWEKVREIAVSMPTIPARLCSAGAGMPGVSLQQVKASVVGNGICAQDHVYASDAWQLAPNLKGQCSNGIRNRNVCCASSCGTCETNSRRHSRCDRRPGGAPKCCLSTIAQEGRRCNGPSDDGCIMQSVREYNAQDYARWAREAARRCVALSKQTSHVAVAKDASFRCYELRGCSLDDSRSNRDWHVFEVVASLGI